MRQFRIALIGAACLATSACNQYIERKDSVTLGAGDAVASNIAIQTRDPWARQSRDNSIPMDGVKAGNALARYRSIGGPRGDAGSQGGAAAAAPPVTR